MKKLCLLVLLILNLSASAHAEGWLDSIKEFMGLGETKTEVQPTAKVADAKTETVDIMGMVSQISSSLNVSAEQAEGGMASLVNYAKNNLSDVDYSALASKVPGIDDLLSKVPDTSNVTSEGMSSMLDQASNYSESLKGANDVKKQFEALGLTPEMISNYVSQAKSYLDTEQGKQAKDLLMEGLSSLTGS